MPSTNNTVYVVTGGNRGIGLGLVKALLARPSTTVIATVRNDEAAGSLGDAVSATVQMGENSHLQVISLDLSCVPAPELLGRTVSDLGHHRVDVLINNAGMSPPMAAAVQTSAEDLRAAFEVNSIAPLVVFQGLWPLLQKSVRPKVIMMTSSVGCIEIQEFPGGAYGPSKAALNWITRALHVQNAESGLVAVAVHPGWVQTGMGESAAKDWGYPHPLPQTVDASVKGILEVMDGATRASVSGKFVTFKGQVLPW